MGAINEKNLALDIEAERLITTVEGGNLGEMARGFSISGLAERLHQEQKRADRRTVHLVKAMTEVANMATASRNGVLDKALEAAGRIREILRELGQMPEGSGALLIRYRGRGLPGEGKASARHDYVILFGHDLIDLTEVRAVADRQGQETRGLPREFQNAAALLTSSGINTLRATLFDLYEDKEDVTGRSLEALCKSIYSISVDEGVCQIGKTSCLPLIRGGDDEPDLNMSILAGLNHLPENTLKSLAAKVSGLLEQAPRESPLSLRTGIFDAVFAFEKLKSQLEKPAIEINNPRWLVAFSEEEALSFAKARVVLATVRAYGANSQKAARTVGALYANDYGQLDGFQLTERLKFISDLLSAVEKRALTRNRKILEEHVLATLTDKLDLVPDAVFDGMEYADRSLRGRNRKGEVIDRALDEKVWDMAVFYRRRSVTRQKVKAMLRHEIHLDDMDFETVARDFGTDRANAEELIQLMAACFDENGRFLKAQFERNIPAFAKHEKVFEFLWHYLKEHMHKNERVAFLNSLQLLIDRLQTPKRAIRVLLEDFSRDPSAVNFHDRNGLLLLNLLLRKYSKELHKTTETTPEKVLNVVEGLDQDRVAFTRNVIDAEKERTFLKVRAINQELAEALDPKRRDFAMPANYLFTLQREVFLLFALVGGVVGVAVLRSALREYGNPKSEIYEFAARTNRIPEVLQTLQVVIRGVRRVGERSDQVVLADLHSRMSDFYDLGKGREHQELVRRVLKWARS